MRIAIVSDIHGNLTALEAVIDDVRQQAPDLVLQGGDLVYGGCAAQEIVDRISQLGWPGVVGNTDEVLWDTSGLDRMKGAVPQLGSLFKVIEDCAKASRSMMSETGMRFLKELPAEHRVGDLLLLHASRGDTWKAPLHSADDQTLRKTYAPLQAGIVVYGHIHRPFVRRVGELMVCNSGSVGMSYDGDPRASYLMVDSKNGNAQVRRVEYDLDLECERLLASDYPHKEWLAQIRRAGAYVPPPG
jgi:putative phosphoesterase